MVLLLRRVQDRSAVDEIRRCADHPDLRVRLEAIRALFAFDSKVPRDLLARTIHVDIELAPWSEDRTEIGISPSGRHVTLLPERLSAVLTTGI